MRLRVVLLTAMLLSLVLGVNNAAVRPAVMPVKTAVPTRTVTQVAANAADAITIPQMLSYQGKLLNASGNPVPDTTYSVVFRLYTVASGGSSFWNETQTVRTRTGLFSVLLGSVTPVESLPQAGTCYLGMKVGSDPEMTPRIRIASAAYAFLAHKADTANYALAGGGGSGDNAWVRVGSDSALYTIRQLGVARGGAGNVLYGAYNCTHTNLGSSSTTGTSGQDYEYCTVGGGYGNSASNQYTTVGGGEDDTASYSEATVGGGAQNTASGIAAFVGSGGSNTAGGRYAFVGDGFDNKASGAYAFVGGGYGNTAGEYAFVGGGNYNAADSEYATVSGGYADTASAYLSFAADAHSVVPASYMNSAALNGQTATASNQTIVGLFSHQLGTFAIDHPLDPDGKILNQYVTGSNEAILTYRGAAVIGSDGRVQAQLPDYFDALNRNPMIQLTGVGSSDVYVAEEEASNRFVIGGKPGIKVFWTVTADRNDQSARIGQLLLPVEQPKTGALVGRSLNDECLVGCMQQLEAMGKAGEFSFRTAAGRQRYEDLLKQLRDAEQDNNAPPARQPVKTGPQSGVPAKLPQPANGLKQPELRAQPQIPQQ